MVDWKKEIKLSDLVGGKKRGEKAEPAPEQKAEPAAAGKSEKTSIWKKEISFGRNKEKPKQDEPSSSAADQSAELADEEAAAAATPVSPLAAPPVGAPTPQPPSTPSPAQPPQPSPAFEPQIVEPVSRKGARDQFGPEVLEPFVPESLPPADSLAVEEVEPHSPIGDPSQLGQYAPQASPEPPRVPPVEPSEEPRDELELKLEEYARAAAPLPSQASETPSEPEPPEPEARPPAPPAPFVPPSTEPSVPEPVAELTAPLPAAHPEPAPPPAPPEPEVVHPPVPADELPPLADDADEERKPFYKRNISFGRKSPQAKPSKSPPAKSPKRARGRGQEAGARKKGPKSLVGLKVGSSQIAAARIANNGHAELLQVAREPLEAGIVVGGELRDPESLGEALKAFFAKHNLPKRGVRLGIANNRIGVRAFEIAGVDDPRQLENAIRFRAQEVLPIPLEEAVLDYAVLAERVTDEGDTIRRILLVVAYRELVDRYMEACRRAGISLAGIDLEGFALLRSLQAPQEHVEGDAALVAVTIGHERSTFAVSDGRVCEFTRVLEWGGAALNVAIARALDTSPGEAEPIKLGLSLYGAEVPAGLSEAQAATAREAMGSQIQSFARELVSSLQFYQNQPGSLGIGEIVITGGTAHLPGLAEELERLIGVAVRVGDPLVRVRVGKKLGEPDQVGSLAVAIGLGIED